MRRLFHLVVQKIAAWLLRCRYVGTRRAGAALLVALACTSGCAFWRDSPTTAVGDSASDNWAGGGDRSDSIALPGVNALASETATMIEGLPPASEDPYSICRSRVTRLDRTSTPFTRSPSDALRLLPPTEAVQRVGFDELPESVLALSPPELVGDTFIETDIRQALQSLAGQANTTIVVDEDVRGVVTATVDNVHFEIALEQVLHPQGYVYRNIGGVYYIGVTDPDSALFDRIAERYRYRAVHRSPEELVAMVSSRRRPFIRPAPTGGWVIVEAPQQQARRVLDELQELDEPVPQVVLGALVCVYSPETSFRFGFDMDSGVRVFNRTTQAAISGLTLSGMVGDAGAGNLNDFRVTQSVLRVLEQKGYVKIRAAPRVMAQDGEKAKIHIGRETFFSVQPESNGAVVFRQDVQQVASGIMLEITPHVREPIITVQIDRAEVSEDIRSDETQANPSDRFPVINRRSVTTTVHVNDGETIVIGGLTQRQKVDQLNSTPVLSKAPLVGRLFQRVEKVDQLVEVAIFISPHIVRGQMHAEATLDDDIRYAPDSL